MCSHDVGMCVPTTSDWIAVLECACVGVCVCVQKTATGSLCMCVCTKQRLDRFAGVCALDPNLIAMWLVNTDDSVYCVCIVTSGSN